MSRNRILRITRNTVLYVIMCLLAFIFLAPVLIMISRSFMTQDQIYLEELLFPTSLNFDKYLAAFDVDFISYLLNTLFVLVFSMIGIPLTSSLCAYSFCKLEYKGRNVLFGCVLATLMLPSIVIQVPTYVIFYRIGWVDTFFPLIVPPFLGGGAINIFLIRQFMKGIPADVTNAAKIDGAGAFRIYLLIVLPLCKMIIIYLAVTAFLGTWNDFMTPLLYIHDESKYTLAIGIYYKMIEGFQAFYYPPNVKMATGVILLLPPLILFCFFQKQIIEGVSAAGLKG